MNLLGARGRVALITGAGRGIGLATARELSRRGAALALVDIDGDECERAASTLASQQVLAIAADVTDAGAMQRAVAETVARFGRLDIVVANAGVALAPATFRTTPAERFERVLDVNLTGVHRTVAAALGPVCERRGQVVLIASVYAFSNGMAEAPYAMSKAAVEQFGRALRAELAPFDVGVTVAYFGFIDTAMVRGTLDADPLADELLTNLPAPLRSRLAPEVAGRALADAIERRKARLILPRRWTALSLMRGFTEPLIDAALVRSGRVQDLLRTLDERGRR
jgi:NAD(P)-dependent dehydrogenase (short-subunit alcohol dehydrogenase family)